MRQRAMLCKYNSFSQCQGTGSSGGRVLAGDSVGLCLYPLNHLGVTQGPKDVLAPLVCLDLPAEGSL